MFETTSHDFGPVARSAKTVFEFPLSNIYHEDIHISSVRTSCGCTTPSIKKAWLKTYEKGAIIARFNTDAFSGSRSATLTVTIDKPLHAQIQLHVKGHIRSDVVLNPGSINLGSVDPGTPAESRATINHTGGSDWRILEVRSSNPHISAKAVPRSKGYGRVSYDLAVRLDETAPAGYIKDRLLLITSDRSSRQIPIAVEGNVLSAGVTVSPASLFLGVLRPGQTVSKRMVLRSSKPFRIKAVSSDGGCFKFDAPAAETRKTLHLIPVTFVAGDNPGKVMQTIRIETDLGRVATEVFASATVSE